MKEKGDVEADGLYFMKGNELTLPESDEGLLKLLKLIIKIYNSI